MLIVFLLLFVCRHSIAFYEQCNKTFVLDFDNREVEILSPNHPNNHPPATPCRWNAKAPPGVQIKLFCQFPDEGGCSGTFKVFEKGPDQYSAPRMCVCKGDAKGMGYDDKQEIKEISVDNEMSLAYISSFSSEGKPFKCEFSLSYQGSECDVIVTKLGTKNSKIESEAKYVTDPVGVCWTVFSPPGTLIYVSHPVDSARPVSDDCPVSFHIYPHGTITEEGSVEYCQSKQFAILSEANKMIIKFKSDSLLFPPTEFFLSVDSIEEGVRECSCGRKNTSRIISGTETGVNEFPWMAAVIHTNKYEHFCGAVLISDRFALTTAHCVNSSSLLKTGLLVGEHDRSTRYDTHATKFYTLEDIIIHQKYRKINSSAYDIALLKTTQEIDMSENVRPVCLPFANQEDTFLGKTVEALGWGYTGFRSQKKSEALLKADFEIVPKESCQEISSEKPGFEFQTKYQLCLFNPPKTTCISDSGGPILWVDPSTMQYKVVGIISSGSCNDTEEIKWYDDEESSEEEDDQILMSFGVRVTSYLDWIVEKTEGTYFCRL